MMIAISRGRILRMTEKAQDNLSRAADKMTKSVVGQTGSHVEHPGRVTAALAADPCILDRSGRTYITAEIAGEYGIADIDGRRIEPQRERRGSPQWRAIREVDYTGK